MRSDAEAEADLLLATGWTWGELQETPAEVVDAVIDRLNRRAGHPSLAGMAGGAGEPRIEL